MNHELYQYIAIKKSHRGLRHSVTENLAEEYSALGLSPEERMTRRFELLCAAEKAVLLPGERICFLRTVSNLPAIFTDSEWKEIRDKHYIHELGFHSNLCPDYSKVISEGLLVFRKNADIYTRRMIDALLSLVDRYCETARRSGRNEIAKTLEQVPRYGARTLSEALQSFRILNFALWLEGNYHNNIGRFDRFMYPYFARDMECGRLNRESALDLLEEFFLTFNRDSDLYPGVQQGDNGQSLMLGGTSGDGECFNLLSELCLTSSRNLKLIDPKINVRVGKDTPDRIFTLCSELTKAGLGFPQYSNDDVVIPGLEKLGYSPEDARDYTVAACWEFIIPGTGADVANIAALSFPQIIDTCLHRDLPLCETWDEFKAAVYKEINTRCDAICGGIKDLWFVPSPFLSTLMNFRDGTPKYQNFGIHGVGLSTAADSLTAVELHIFGNRSLSPGQLIRALDTDFVEDPGLLHKLRFETAKLGMNDNTADGNLSFLTNAFADSLEGRVNCRGGGWRAGTGSAMYYLWSADEIGASPDGRRKGEPFSANYSVSLFARPDGPFSLIRSMVKPDLKRVINGGPLTLEFHDTVFETPEATEQVGQLVKQFIHLGGHQLQLNAVNAETLRDAQAHPEKYPQLIVRIWGWSAYFVELDKAYQEHVIARQEYEI